MLLGGYDRCDAVGGTGGVNPSIDVNTVFPALCTISGGEVVPEN